MKTTIKKILAIVIALTTLTTLCSCAKEGEPNFIFSDISDYITVKFEGSNGYGEAVIANADTFLDEIVSTENLQKFKDKAIKKYGTDVGYALANIETASGLFEVNLAEENRYLSNGDIVVVVVEASYDMRALGYTAEDLAKDFGISLNGIQIEYTVAGLKEIQEIDILKNIEEHTYVYSSGFGYYCIRFNNDKDELQLDEVNDIALLYESDYWLDNRSCKKFKVVPTGEEKSEDDLSIYIYFDHELSDNRFDLGDKYGIHFSLDEEDSENLARLGYKVARTKCELVIPEQLP